MLPLKRLSVMIAYRNLKGTICSSLFAHEVANVLGLVYGSGYAGDLLARLCWCTKMVDKALTTAYVPCI